MASSMCLIDDTTKGIADKVGLGGDRPIGMGCDLAGLLECVAVLEIGRDARAAESVVADFWW